MKIMNKMKISSRLTLGVAMLCISVLGLKASDQNVDKKKPALLPMPQSIEWKEDAITLNQVNVVLPQIKGDDLRVSQLKAELDKILKKNKIIVSGDAKTQILLQISKVEGAKQWAGQDKEAYKLVASNTGVVISANTVAGLYNGVQTLRQLVVNKNGKATVAACEIHDYPAFKIRGFMHDVGRNFQSIEQLKMQIDVMAKHKMNVFHWHLTDHFGWRLESKKYPDLQSEKAFGRHHGKFYTQAEFKDMADYCWARGIMIIPEFDSPGHSEAFRHGLGIKNMKEPRALSSMIGLVDELCSLVDAKRMPYVHVGTDEVRHAEERVNGNYLPALHKAVQANGREVIGWSKGMTFRGAKQVSQTWANSRPFGGTKHIDSRSNYVNHLEALDFASRMFFQQPCRVPHGDEVQIGGILAYWPDTYVEFEKVGLTNNPVIPAMVAYSEAVWKGIAKDRSEFWAKLPNKGTAEYAAYANFEDRIAEMRDRFHSNTPFIMVKTYDIEWRLLGQVANNEVPELEKGMIKDSYDVDGKKMNWSAPVYGGAIHSRHFFGFSSRYGGKPRGKTIVWGNTNVYSPVDQEVDAWISFNTISTSDKRAGSALDGDWSSNKDCNIWINGERIDPPKWKNPGKLDKEIALIDNVYTSREPAKIKLKKGWNSVLVKSAPTWKWVFSFSPVEKNGNAYREVKGLKYSATIPSK
mgnify:CR=1 FL=1